jgi:hypothetical protein
MQGVVGMSFGTYALVVFGFVGIAIGLAWILPRVVLE